MQDSKSEENSTSSRELIQNYLINLYVEMIDPKDNNKSYVECFKNFDLKEISQGRQGINIMMLTSAIKNYGFQLEGRIIGYYSSDCQMYVNCGMDPVHPDYHIPWSEVINFGQLRLKCTASGISLIHLMMSEEMNEAVNKMKELENNENQEQENQTKQCRRTKERRIGYIIEKVQRWREYYNGVNQNGALQRYTLDEAARKVAISKKSLDDYLLQIRYGRKFGFNFNEHRNDKVGVLRTFVKQHNKQKKKKGHQNE